MFASERTKFNFFFVTPKVLIELFTILQYENLPEMKRKHKIERKKRDKTKKIFKHKN